MGAAFRHNEGPECENRGYPQSDEQAFALAPREPQVDGEEKRSPRGNNKPELGVLCIHDSLRLTTFPNFLKAFALNVQLRGRFRTDDHASCGICLTALRCCALSKTCSLFRWLRL